jgi:hypothetical protein
MSEEEKSEYVLNPWQPEQDRIALAVLGKMLEELNECGAITARCIIQGIDECEPVTGLLNKDELENEIADALAAIHMTRVRFRLDATKIDRRMWKKCKHLGDWHHLLETKR